MISAVLQPSRRMALLTLATLALAAPGAGQAQSFPSKPITIVVPYPAGGTTDTLARVMQEPLQKLLGQTIIIENRPGASAIVGTKLVANAPPDGYTLLMPNNALAITPHVSKEGGWTIKDFAPISMISLQPMVLISNPILPAHNVAQLIDYAKANPGKVEFATSGPASFGHLATELFMRQAGIQMTHIPYKGTAPIAQALLTGEVKVLLSTTTSQMNQYVKEGRLRMIGVASAEPSPLAPGAEPIMKTLKDYQAEVWFGLLAPAGTPKAVITRLNEAVVKVLQMPEMKGKFEMSGAAPAPSTPEQFAARIADENASWSKVVREAGIKAE